MGVNKVDPCSLFQKVELEHVEDGLVELEVAVVQGHHEEKQEEVEVEGLAGKEVGLGKPAGKVEVGLEGLADKVEV